MSEYTYDVEHVFDPFHGAVLRPLPVTEVRVRVIDGAVVLDVPGQETPLVALAFSPETARMVAESLVRFADQARAPAPRLDVDCGTCGAQAGERGTPYCPGCYGIIARVMEAR